jgi:hypothetical protein
MPGSGRLLSFEFPNGTRLTVVLLTILLFANLAGSFAADFWVEHYASHQPSFAHPFPVNLGSGGIAYVPSWLGFYQHWSFSLHFVLFGLIFIMLGWYAIRGQAIVYSHPRRP